ncbi:hypothetical protein PN437_04530 [Microcystis aeruginosa CS-564/01]|uniref:hypothetical protein n=1 Tax=Microcystis aeruginosa TaxID=1126 RepID=UPI002330F02D|nr:hypothetical protein [Microcystis aeruginosa]MDB9424189.1 hypothetical protein [Microcystis aeruginosa CS-564/01]
MLEQMMKMLEGQQINSYRLNKFLGAGGFGGVFHASEREDMRPPYQGGIKGGSKAQSIFNLIIITTHLIG